MLLLDYVSSGGLTGEEFISRLAQVAYRVHLLAVVRVMATCFFKASSRERESLARWNPI